MIVLGIETTCDETAAAVVRRDPDGGGHILSDVVFSQIEEHAAFGGVVPEIAARAHLDVLDGVIARALAEAGVTLPRLDGIAAAAGPGLVGGLIVGLTSAKVLALALDKPLMAVNHLEAHALTARLTDGVAFPYLLLLVSGGHTQLVAVEQVGRYRKLGGTVDDALGEAFDKVAKMLGLPYPGGPHVEAAALRGDPQRFDFPRPMAGRSGADFSLSGLKTAVRIAAQRIAPLSETDVADLCASFQAAAVDVVTDRTQAGDRLFRTEFGETPTALVVAGGVGSNAAIRQGLQRVATECGIALVAPPAALCTDNGAMIAWAGAERLAQGLTDLLSAPPRPRWPLEQIASAAAP